MKQEREWSRLKAPPPAGFTPHSHTRTTTKLRISSVESRVLVFSQEREIERVREERRE
jgi:hypothetical protein